MTVAELDGADGFTKQPQAYMLHAAPGMTASVPAEVVPSRRGLHVLDRFQISTSFPFGFIKRAVDRPPPRRAAGLPALAQVDRKVLTLCRAAEKTGASIRPRKGGSDEFYGVKEYRPGDNPRWIYWRRSARTAAAGGLVAKEMTHVAPPRLMLLVDTFLPRERSARAAIRPRHGALCRQASIEQTIAMAASLGRRRPGRGACRSGLSPGPTGGRHRAQPRQAPPQRPAVGPGPPHRQPRPRRRQPCSRGPAIPAFRRHRRPVHPGPASIAPPRRPPSRPASPRPTSLPWSPASPVGRFRRMTPPAGCRLEPVDGRLRSSRAASRAVPA